MLAERGLPATGLDGWSVEPKLDGWRALVTVHPGLPGGVAVRTRRGHPLTVPGMEALAATGLRAVLDGELVAGAGTTSDFYALFPRPVQPGSRQRDIPLSFWAFDLLWLNDRLLLDRPYSERRTILEQLPLTGPCKVVRRFPGVDAMALLAACHALDVEGIVLKHLRSTYRPGQRSRHWRKVKVPGWTALHAQQRGPR